LSVFDAPNTSLIICSFIFIVQANPILILVLQIDKFLMGFFLYYRIYFENQNISIRIFRLTVICFVYLNPRCENKQNSSTNEKIKKRLTEPKNELIEIE